MCAGWIADSENINLEVSRLDEVCCDGGLTRGGEILHEAQADVLVEGEAVAGGGDGPAELPVPVETVPASSTSLSPSSLPLSLSSSSSFSF